MTMFPTVRPPLLDAAAFRDSDIIAVYGERPRSPFTLQWQWVDKAHTLGRGEHFGVKKGDPRRILFSSIYNFGALDRDIHKGPLRDHALFRRLMLEVAIEKVQWAAAQGRYEPAEIDERFLEEIARPWMKETATWFAL